MEKNMTNDTLKNILSHLGEAVFVLDRSGHVIYVNDYFLQHSMFTKDEVLQMDSPHLFENKQTDINIFEMVKEQKGQITAVQKITNPQTGQTKRFLVTQTPIMDANGEVDCIVGVIRDIDLFLHSVNYIRSSGEKVYKPDFKTSDNKPMERPIFASKEMDKLFGIAEALARSDATILILGESGVGKEVLSNYIHKKSLREKKALVAINCASLNAELLESELFGYVKGAFTGASNKGKKGLIELADNGTLFLDEIDSLPLALQAKLLRVLETHEIRPIGGQENIKVDFRVIAATNANLEDLVAKHEFREDLYYRLNVLPLVIPPLRQRKEDIPVLVNYFLNYFETKYGRKKVLSDQVMKKLLDYTWPGNVRELRNFVERVVLVTDSSVVEIKDIPDVFLKQVEKTNSNNIDQVKIIEELSLKDQLHKMEGQMIEEAILRCGSLGKAADLLKMPKSTLIRKRNQYRESKNN